MRVACREGGGTTQMWEGVEVEGGMKGWEVTPGSILAAELTHPAHPFLVSSSPNGCEGTPESTSASVQGGFE